MPLNVVSSRNVSNTILRTSNSRSRLFGNVLYYKKCLNQSFFGLTYLFKLFIIRVNNMYKLIFSGSYRDRMRSTLVPCYCIPYIRIFLGIGFVWPLKCFIHRCHFHPQLNATWICFLPSKRCKAHLKRDWNKWIDVNYFSPWLMQSRTTRLFLNVQPLAVESCSQFFLISTACCSSDVAERRFINKDTAARRSFCCISILFSVLRLNCYLQKFLFKSGLERVAKTGHRIESEWYV